MSEYQYYEFLAIDRPLSKEQMAHLRSLSTRAEISSTRFQNVYNWGDFRGDPEALMEEFFDAFVYVANWGTREFMLRLPRRLLGPEVTSLYCACDGMDALMKGDFTVLSFHSESDEGGWEEGEGWMESLVPVRSELASGDLRALYLGWLLCAQNEFLDGDTVEPPVPPGLATLSESLESLVDFLDIDTDLIAEAAERSAPLAEAQPTGAEVERWVLALSASEKDELLLRLVNGDPSLRAELLQRYRRSRSQAGEPSPTPHARTVEELLSARDERAERRRREDEWRKAEERARVERERAAARARHLESLAGREEELWQRVESLVQTKRPKDYDNAAELVRDLRDLAARAGANSEFDRRLWQLRERHGKKPSFIERLDRLK
jgi:hypothetical protein